VDETLRLVQAIQFHAKYGEVRRLWLAHTRDWRAAAGAGVSALTAAPPASSPRVTNHPCCVALLLPSPRCARPTGSLGTRPSWRTLSAAWSTLRQPTRCARAACICTCICTRIRTGTGGNWRACVAP
jgi:hypothetical protein